MTDPRARYQLQVFLSQIGSRELPPPVILPAVPSLNGEEFLRWLAETAPLHRSTALNLITNDDRTTRSKGGTCGWHLVGKIFLPV